MLDFSRLRMKNLIPPIVSQPDDMSGGIAPEQQMQMPTEQTAPGIYNPRTDLSTALNDALQNPPTRQPVGKMRNILGALATLSTNNPGQKLAVKDAIVNKKYNQEQGDYKSRIDDLMKGANEEDRYNVNERLRASSVANVSQKERDSEIRAKDAETRRLKSEQQYEVAQDKLQQKYDATESQAQMLRDKLAAGDVNSQRIKEWHMAETAAKDARHALDISAKDRALEVQKQHYEDILKPKPPTEENTVVKRDAQGNVISSTKTKGPTEEQVMMLSKDGKTKGMVPKSKVQQAIKDGLSLPPQE